MADQVKGHSEGYDILEKEQAQKTHVPHPVNPRYGNNRTRGRYNHSAGCKEHDRCDEPSYDAGNGAKIARDNQDGGGACPNTTMMVALRASSDSTTNNLPVWSFMTSFSCGRTGLNARRNVAGATACA
jgi:hypothetical protein